ncbi:hypothetical protein [Enterococcus sp. 5H]|uniref:hypothetical protein n=1 Tax=Enterococcus sp. 5H TaxID=1229490 RepID=UPI002304C33E|nr:hypothetical protein [Enterococcus sp. 5H]MDA9472288.1 hypothetical protein [Enterococcus sp. 5H]
MRNLKITRSMILAFILGLSLSNLSIGSKLCISIPMVLIWLISYDDAAIEGNDRKHDYPIR